MKNVHELDYQKDLGWTEDEKNNFLIELFGKKKTDNKQMAINTQNNNSLGGKSVTIKLTKENFT